jgi:hypothetical protein
MKRDDIMLIAQILSTMKNTVAELEKSITKNSSDNITIAKKQLLELREQLSKLI